MTTETLKNFFKSVLLIIVLFATTNIFHTASADDGSTLINPLDALQNDYTVISSFAYNPVFGKYTGADGLGDNKWAVTTELGYLEIREGINATLNLRIDTGYSNLVGVAQTFNGIALFAGRTIYLGNINNSQWNETGSIDLLGLTSNLTDGDYALGHFFISTESNIRRVNADGTSTKVANGSYQSIEIYEFESGIYTNPMEQIGSNIFSNIDMEGNQFGSGKMPNMHNSSTVQGVANFQGGTALVQKLGVQVYDPLVSGIKYNAVPEPSAMLLFVSGGFCLLRLARKCKI